MNRYESNEISRKKYLRMEKMMCCGEKATIIQYENDSDMIVMFEDGTVVTHVKLQQFLSGHVEKFKNGEPPSTKKSTIVTTPSTKTPLSDFDLPLKILNCLKIKNLTTVEQILAIPDEKLISMTRLSKKNIEILKCTIQSRNTKTDDQEKQQIPKFTPEDLAKTIEQHLSKNFKPILSDTYIYNVICDNIDMFDKTKTLSEAISDETMMQVIYRDCMVRNTVKELIKHILTNKASKCSSEDIKKYLPISLIVSSELSDILMEMVHDRILDFYIGDYSIRHETISEYIEKLPLNDMNIVSTRLNGATYEDIAKQYKISMQNAYKITNGIFKKHIKVFENRYKYWYMNYDIDKDLFCKLFKTTPFIYNYIKETSYKGTKTKFDLMSDPYISPEQKKIIENKVPI